MIFFNPTATSCMMVECVFFHIKSRSCTLISINETCSTYAMKIVMGNDDQARKAAQARGQFYHCPHACPPKVSEHNIRALPGIVEKQERLQIESCLKCNGTISGYRESYCHLCLF
jgi:hypothetical protein